MKLYGLKSNPKKRRYIITYEGNYHGKTLGSQMLSGQPADKEWIGYHDPNIVHLPFPYPWVVEKFKGTGKELFRTPAPKLSKLCATRAHRVSAELSVNSDRFLSFTNAVA